VNYDNFITLVNKINSDNILSTLKELNDANIELATFNPENVDRTDVLQAVQKLKECNEKYQTLKEYLEKVNQSSDNVGKLLGGK
jgi:DNA-binding transcriptional regulator GbsR (MarR family)